LALLLALQPTILLAASFDEVYQGYLRGEISLGEMEAARQRHNRASTRRALPQVGRASANADSLADSGGLVEEDPPKAGLGEKVKKIGRWIRDIPKRTLRRVAPEQEGLATAAQAREHIENSVVPAYTANGAQREADSTWVRPVKVTAQAEVEKVQSVITRVVTFGGLSTLAAAASGKASAKAAVAKATQIVAKLDSSQKRRLLAGLSGGSVGKMLRSMISGKPTSAVGRLVKDSFGNNILLAVAASGIVTAFLDDGLDLDTLKDHLVALNALEGKRTRRESFILQPIEAVAYFHADKALSGAWKSLWTKATAGSGRIATMLTGADNALRAAGARMVQTPPAHLAGKAAAFGRQAASLGLPGVSGATSLSLMGAAESIFKAGTMGLIGMPVIETGWRMLAGEREGVVIGGNRGRTFAMYNFYDTYYQRTGSKWKDAIEERKNSTANLWGGYERWPFQHSFQWFLRFVGGYTGAVIASSVVAPVGFATFGVSLVVSAIFAEGGVAVGKWAGAKLDTSPGAYRRTRKKNMKKIFKLELELSEDTPERRRTLQALAEMDRFRATLGLRSRRDVVRVLKSGGSDGEKLARLAREYTQAKRAYLAALARKADARADDFEKMIRGSQINSRIKYVRSFDDVKLYRDKGYVQMEMPGFKSHASPRYDIVTAEGRRGVWDFRTNRVLDVGKVSENNGNRIAFLDDKGVVVKDGVLQTKDDSELEKEIGNAFITNNGVIFEKAAKGALITKGKKRGKKKSEWLVRGYGGEYDIVLRDSRRRFAWDGERFLEVGSSAEAASKAAKLKGEGEASSKRLSARKRRKAERAAAKAKSAEAKVKAENQAFSAKVIHKLVKGVAKVGSPSDQKAILESLGDLGKLYKSSGDSLGERYTKVLAKSL
jgi:hypothetical protein